MMARSNSLCIPLLALALQCCMVEAGQLRRLRGLSTVEKPENGVACLTADQCKQRFQDLNFSGYFYESVANSSKGCFSKGDNVYFGTDGSEEEMSTADLPGTRERIWCLRETPAPTDTPSKQPTPSPSRQPSASPSQSPSVKPASPAPTEDTLTADNVTKGPTKSPVSRPPMIEEIVAPEPSPKPSVSPSKQPTSSPTRQPSASPSQSPSAKPVSPEPTADALTADSTDPPTLDPLTTGPTTVAATPEPTKNPSSAPSRSPSPQPTVKPITDSPINIPAFWLTGDVAATGDAEDEPTDSPSWSPTDSPVIATVDTDEPTADDLGEKIEVNSDSTFDITPTSPPTDDGLAEEKGSDSMEIIETTLESSPATPSPTPITDHPFHGQPLPPFCKAQIITQNKGYDELPSWCKSWVDKNPGFVWPTSDLVSSTTTTVIPMELSQETGEEKGGKKHSDKTPSQGGKKQPSDKKESGDKPSQGGKEEDPLDDSSTMSTTLDSITLDAEETEDPTKDTLGSTPAPTPDELSASHSIEIDLDETPTATTEATKSPIVIDWEFDNDVLETDFAMLEESFSMSFDFGVHDTPMGSTTSTTTGATKPAATVAAKKSTTTTLATSTGEKEITHEAGEEIVGKEPSDKKPSQGGKKETSNEKGNKPSQGGKEESAEIDKGEVEGELVQNYLGAKDTKDESASSSNKKWYIFGGVLAGVAVLVGASFMKEKRRRRLDPVEPSSFSNATSSDPSSATPICAGTWGAPNDEVDVETPAQKIFTQHSSRIQEANLATAPSMYSVPNPSEASSAMPMPVLSNIVDAVESCCSQSDEEEQTFQYA